MSEYRQRLKVTVRLMSHRFRYQTYVTAVDIGLNVVSEVWPLVLPSQQLTSLFDAKMARQRIVMMTAD